MLLSMQGGRSGVEGGEGVLTSMLDSIGVEE